MGKKKTRCTARMCKARRAVLKSGGMAGMLKRLRQVNAKETRLGFSLGFVGGAGAGWPHATAAIAHHDADILCRKNGYDLATSIAAAIFELPGFDIHARLGGNLREYLGCLLWHLELTGHIFDWDKDVQKVIDLLLAIWERRTNMTFEQQVKSQAKYVRDRGKRDVA